MAPMRLS